MSASLAQKAIQKSGALLVFPLANRPEPQSLWSSFFPRSKMEWEWSEDGNDRVAKLWHLRTVLSESEKVVYAKWYQGRATLFSRDVFRDLLAFLNPASSKICLQSVPQRIFDQLQENSPLSTKVIKSMTNLRGKILEPTFTSAMKELWERLLVVGFGEVDDGAFPSLAIGASELLFEDLWKKSRLLTRPEALHSLTKKLGVNSPFLRFAMKIGARDYKVI